MQFQWPTKDQMIYRVTRLRRLVAVAITIPVAVLLIGSALDPAFLSPDRASVAAICVALLVVGHVVLFPNVPLETISLSIALAVLTLAAPFVRQLAGFAPAEHAPAALVMLICLATIAAVVIAMLLQIVLGLAATVGPAVRLKLGAAIDVPCSPQVARSQFALQPGTRRGRILTGDSDPNGFFDVAILAPQVTNPDNPTQPLVVRVAAKIVQEDAERQQTMVVLPTGDVTVTVEHFLPAPEGCRVEMFEMPGDFTLGMYVLFWLTDQQMDNLTETADMITGHPVRANGLAHGVSCSSILAAILSPAPPIAG